jgi:hypothetical protein
MCYRKPVTTELKAQVKVDWDALSARNLFARSAGRMGMIDMHKN